MFNHYIKLTTIALVSIYLTTGCSSHASNNSNPNENSTPPSLKAYKQKALIIAVQDYAGENDLIGILKDRDHMKSLFETWGFDTKVLGNSLNFEQKLVDYADTLKKDDVFILYYSGHGSSMRDYNNDENDGKDEFIVLSDSNTNLFYVDDKIDTLLSKIEAKKLLIFDSCNSGTVHKDTLLAKNIDKKVIKYLAVPENYTPDTTITKKFLRKNTQTGPLVFFAACQDYEQSIASSSGSLFTNSFLKEVGLDKPISQVLTDTTLDLNRSNVMFHPNLTSSDNGLKNSTLRKYLKID